MKEVGTSSSDKFLRCDPVTAKLISIIYFRAYLVESSLNVLFDEYGASGKYDKVRASVRD